MQKPTSCQLKAFLIKGQNQNVSITDENLAPEWLIACDSQHLALPYVIRLRAEGVRATHIP